MIKKCVALMLALLLTALCFGCGQKTPEVTDTTTTKAPADKEPETTVKTLTAGSKIAFFVNNASQDIQFNPVVLQLAGAYDKSVMTVAIPDDSVSNTLQVARTAIATALDPEVRVMIFSGAAADVANALKQVREKRDDVTLIVCDPVEDTAEMRAYADLILRVDYKAYAADAVKRAKEMGAESFVFLTSARELKLFEIAAMKQAAQTTCEKEKMTFKAAAIPDMLDGGSTQASGEQFIAEEVNRQYDKFGEKTALFCVSPQLQGAVARQAAQHGMIMPATFRPSPLMIAEGVGVSMEGHEDDAAYAVQQMKKQADSLGLAGHVSTWGVNVPGALLRTAFAYAQAVVDGDDALTEETLRTYLPDDAVTAKLSDGVVTVSAETIDF